MKIFVLNSRYSPGTLRILITFGFYNDELTSKQETIIFKVS